MLGIPGIRALLQNNYHSLTELSGANIQSSRGGLITKSSLLWFAGREENACIVRYLVFYRCRSYLGAFKRAGSGRLTRAKVQYASKMAEMIELIRQRATTW